MRSAFMSGPHAVELRQLDLPKPAANELLVDVTSCGVCGSNLHEWPNPQGFFLRVPARSDMRSLESSPRPVPTRATGGSVTLSSCSRAT